MNLISSDLLFNGEVVPLRATSFYYNNYKVVIVVICNYKKGQASLLALLSKSYTTP